MWAINMVSNYFTFHIMVTRDKHIMLLLQPITLCLNSHFYFIPLRYLLFSHDAQNSYKINLKNTDNVTFTYY